MENNFFDKIQDAVIFAGREVKEAAGDLSERAKLRYEIRTREGYLNELYMELGKKYYMEHKDDEREEEGGLNSFTEVKNLLEELDDLRAELANKKGARHCPRCGAQVSQDSDYCGKCGAFMHEE